MEKPGYKTTEFWLSLAAVVLGALIASGVFGDESTAMKVIGVGAMILNALGYTVARGSVKKAAGKTSADSALIEGDLK